MSDETTPSRDDLCSAYLDQLPFDPYPVQEDALLAWFSTRQGVLVCAPTGTGKTLIAEAAIFEALHAGTTAYYTTPLIALTEQKFREVQAAAVRWGFQESDVGLVTGNRRVNPDARILVVVAEILLNRLLHPTAFAFDDVSAVVMDEFHSFADYERGIVWELSLTMLPSHVRLLLLSATVGNSAEFIDWLNRNHGRRVDLIQSFDRKVPLSFEWVGDQLLNEQIQLMSSGDEDSQRTPALLFCFNRNECWDVAEQLKGKHLLDRETQKTLAAEIERFDWSQGAGPKLKRLLIRGVGVHHAGLLPKYRRIVEQLFQRKLLRVTVCTETLAAGMNLPARSVVLTSLIKGPPQKKKLIDASSAHQMFGRAGRPQFDSRGYVYALAHEDDVKILRWKEKYDQIPEDSKDPKLIRAKKQMKKKMPTRRSTQQYWNEAQFQKLQTAPPGNLSSRGPLPWRLLAHLLEYSPEVARLDRFLARRMMSAPEVERNQRSLVHMLKTLWAGNYVELEPPPPAPEPDPGDADSAQSDPTQSGTSTPAPTSNPTAGWIGELIKQAQDNAPGKKPSRQSKSSPEPSAAPERPRYAPRIARPTEKLARIPIFRSVNPIYANFLLEHFGRADAGERLQLLESVLDVPRSLFFQVRIPGPDRVPPGALATEFLDELILTRGLATAEEIRGAAEEPDPSDRRFRDPPLALADKMRRYFDSEFPGIDQLRTLPVWIAGDLLEFQGDFDKYVRGRDLTKQEGIVFRHLLRLILLTSEFAQLTPDGLDAQAWQAEMNDLAETLTESCRTVDPASTDQLLESISSQADSETAATAATPPTDSSTADDFGSGLETDD